MGWPSDLYNKYVASPLDRAKMQQKYPTLADYQEGNIFDAPPGWYDPKTGAPVVQQQATAAQILGGTNPLVEQAPAAVAAPKPPMSFEEMRARSVKKKP